MNLLYICYEDLSASIAPTIHTIEVCKNLSRLGHQVILIAPDMGRYEQQNLPFKIVYIPVIDLPYLKPIIFSLLLLFYLTFYLLKMHPNCLYIRGATFISFSASLWAKVFALPYLVEVNGLNPVWSWGKSPFTMMLKLDQILGEYSMKMANKIIAISEGLKKELCQRYKIREEKIAVVYNGTDIEVFRPLDKRETKQRLGIDENTNYICFVGSFYKYHGVEYLVKSMPLIIRHIPKTRLLLIGTGGEKTAIEQMVREEGLMDSIIFVGEIPYRMVALYVNAADVCVMPLIKTPFLAPETSPLKMYDYLACARSVVGTNLPGIGDFLEGIDAGISVPPEDPAQLAQAIVSLLNDPLRAERMGKNGRKVVVEKYSWYHTSIGVANACAEII